MNRFRPTRPSRFLAAVLALGLLVLTGCGLSSGSKYPERPVEMVVSFGPGGGTDVTARAVAGFAAKKWGSSISVVNKPGGAGATGTVAVKQAKADGYTLLMQATSSGVTNPALQSSLPYKWDDFAFIARVGVSPIVFVVKGDSKWNTLQDVVNAVKQDPTKYKYGTTGGGPSTFGVAQVMRAAGVDASKLSQVVLDGGAKVVANVAGGHVDFAAQNLSEVISLVEGGKVKALAISSETRAKTLPKVPTGKEAGFPQFNFAGFFGLMGPKDTPADVVKKWADVIKEAVNDPSFAASLEKQGVVPAFQGPEDFKKFAGDLFKDSQEIGKQLKLIK